MRTQMDTLRFTGMMMPLKDILQTLQTIFVCHAINYKLHKICLLQGQLLKPRRRRKLSPAIGGCGPHCEDGGRVDSAALGCQMERLRVRRDPLGSGTISSGRGRKYKMQETNGYKL